jgi:hypothetical protein
MDDDKREALRIAMVIQARRIVAGEVDPLHGAAAMWWAVRMDPRADQVAESCPDLWDQAANFEDLSDVLEQRQDVPQERSRLEAEICEAARTFLERFQRSPG